MGFSQWKHCLKRLENELTPQQFNTWIRPLQVIEKDSNIKILAPNRFVMDWVSEKYLSTIREIINNGSVNNGIIIDLGIGSGEIVSSSRINRPTVSKNITSSKNREKSLKYSSNLNSDFTFSSFIGGKSNQLALAASVQTSKNPGNSYNPLFIYGGVGLGKTHLMHAIGHTILEQMPGTNVTYLHSERFVADMVKALQHNAINEFKKYYRSLDVLLIDDIQFFAGKERSQEEFFHTFNALLEGQNQIVLTCDRYPKEVNGLEERLKSRFGWGLTVSIEPPELETRVAILKKKAERFDIILEDEVAFFIARRFRSNVRELEGALNRVIANSNLTGNSITLEFSQEALRDLLLIQDKQISLENIKKTTAEYFQIRVADLLSKRRNRSITRPRQIAMAISKDITNHSLPEIGDSFGGRDHTTVLHACRKVNELRKEQKKVEEDYDNLIKILTC